MTRARESAKAGSAREAAVAWCIRLKTGGRLSADEEATLRAWIEADPDAERSMADCLEAWEALDTVSDAPEMVALRADALDQLRRGNRQRWRRPIRFDRLAASAAALVVAGVLGLAAMTIDRDEHHDLSTARGEQRAILLADGSRISLDSRSRMTVALSRGQRQLNLSEGRAKFDVAHDPDRPFTVRVGEHLVVATGTSFSTELLNGKLHVILYEGSVAIVDGQTPDPRTLLAIHEHPHGRAVGLRPGQEFIADAGRAGGAVRNDAPLSLSWERGLLDFTDEPLADAAAQLNRYSDDMIVVRDPKAAKIKISGVFQAGRSRQFLEAISAVYPVSVTPSGPHQFDVTM
jgi:transmembrane sensor